MIRMLIAFDGSEHAKHAIEAAAKLARGGVALEALLVTVSDSPGYYGELPPFDYDSLVGRLRTQQDALLASAQEHARLNGLERVTTEGAIGSPAKEIVRIARERSVDQIVMGTRGMNALGGLLLGSVAQRVVHLSSVPVLLVK